VLATILQRTDQSGRIARGVRLCRDHQRIADDQRCHKAAGQSLQPARSVDGVADNAEGQALLAADIADDRRSVIEPNADRPEATSDDAANALKCADMMLAALERWNAERAEAAEPRALLPCKRRMLC